jgi:hypothetical protein
MEWSRFFESGAVWSSPKHPLISLLLKRMDWRKKRYVFSSSLARLPCRVVQQFSHFPILHSVVRGLFTLRSTSTTKKPTDTARTAHRSCDLSSHRHDLSSDPQLRQILLHRASRPFRKSHLPPRPLPPGGHRGELRRAAATLQHYSLFSPSLCLFSHTAIFSRSVSSGHCILLSLPTDLDLMCALN